MVENGLSCTDRAPRGWLQSLNVSRYINNVALSYHGLGSCCPQIGKIHNIAYLKSFFSKGMCQEAVCWGISSVVTGGIFFFFLLAELFVNEQWRW